MYGYEEHIELTPDQILQKLTQQQIFELVLKLPFNFNERYKSPFRQDKRGDCRFEERQDGTILFVDFGEINSRKIHRSCFGMMLDAYPGYTLNGIIKILCNEFKLSTDIRDYQYISNTYNTNNNSSIYNNQEESSEETIIKYRRKAFSRLDVLHWSQFIIKTEHLIEDNVSATNLFTVKKPNKLLKTINVYKYCYAIDFIHHVKLYQPYSDKYKWITNCNENDIGNIDNLPATGDELIIEKAYKDHRVLRNLNLNLNVIWFQNEGQIPDLYILKNLTERFKLIYIFFDPDETGITSALKLHAILESFRQDCARIVHLPIFISRKLNHKDVSEFVHKEGRNDLIEILKQIKIL